LGFKMLDAIEQNWELMNIQNDGAV